MAAPKTIKPSAGGGGKAAAKLATGKRITLRLYRFNPDTDEKPVYREYTVTADPTDRVLDALNQVKWYEDGSLTYRRSCAHGICGSDAMRINGVNRLACKVLIRDVGEHVTIEPLMGFRVIKDLVVDMEPFFAQYRSVLPFLINDSPVPDNGRETPAGYERGNRTARTLVAFSVDGGPNAPLPTW